MDKKKMEMDGSHMEKKTLVYPIPARFMATATPVKRTSIPPVEPNAPMKKKRQSARRSTSPMRRFLESWCIGSSSSNRVLHRMSSADTIVLVSDGEDDKENDKPGSYTNPIIIID